MLLLDDGRLELDTNISDRAKLGAKNMDSRPGVLEFNIEPGQVFRVLVGCIVLLAAAGIAVSVAAVGFGRPTLYGLGPLFDLDREATVPALFSCSMLVM